MAEGAGEFIGISSLSCPAKAGIQYAAAFEEQQASRSYWINAAIRG
jgi:hypothetical protein